MSRHNGKVSVTPPMTIGGHPLTHQRRIDPFPHCIDTTGKFKAWGEREAWVIPFNAIGTRMIIKGVE